MVSYSVPLGHNPSVLDVAVKRSFQNTSMVNSKSFKILQWLPVIFRIKSKYL